HTPPSPLGCQRVEAYIQQRDEVLWSLRISPAEFTRHARALLVSLGHNDLSGTPEQWANCLLEFHKLYQCGAIPKSARNTLQVDLHLWNKLRTLVDKIHTSPTPWHFEDPVDPARLFHVQRKEPIEPRDPVSTPVPHQQEELNAASNILKALNLTGEHFDQPTAHTIGLSVHPHVNSLPSTFCTWEQLADANPHPNAPLYLPPTNNNNASTHTLSYINELEAPGGGLAPPGRAPTPEFQCDGPPHFDLRHLCSNTPPPHNNSPPLRQPAAPGPPLPGGPPPLQWAQRPPPGNNGGPPPGSEPPNGRPLSGWGLADAFPPQHGRRNHYYYYYNTAPPLCNPNPQDDICDTLTCKGKLDIQKPKRFHGHDPCKWRMFLTQCLTMFQAKPLTFQLESSRVAFAALYLQSITFDHYMALLWVDPNSLVLSNWQAFSQEFSSKFGVFDTVAETKENLFNLWMCNDK
ncbi:hypothetical protein C0993_008841, partial [Termitomyces sp. T159_Od127]